MLLTIIGVPHVSEVRQLYFPHPAETTSFCEYPSFLINGNGNVATHFVCDVICSWQSYEFDINHSFISLDSLNCTEWSVTQLDATTIGVCLSV